MENKLRCEIVQDLLPSYIDGLTSDVTNEAVQEHVAGCTTCKKIMERMKEPEQIHSDVIQKEEIDFLKKTKKRTQRTICLSIVSVVVCVMAILFIRFYCVGSALRSEAIICRATVSDQTVALSGMVTDSGLGISDIDFEEEEGVITVSFDATLASPFHKGDFTCEYQAMEPITQVRVGERIVWDNGVTISSNVSAAYLAKHAYVGDMSANGESVTALGMTNVLGNFKNELQTSQEPYGWKMILEEEISSKNHDIMEQQMKAYSYVLLATIDNLGYVTFEYNTEKGNTNLTVTEKDASVFAGQDIKACAATAAELQMLMQKAGLNEYALPSARTGEETVSLNIVQNSDAEIKEMAVCYYLDGNLCGSQGSGAVACAVNEKTFVAMCYKR